MPTSKSLRTEEGGLTLSQLKFCEEYMMNGFNASEAARKAGYSHKSGPVSASQFLRKQAVQEYIQKRMKQMVEKMQEEYNVTFSYKINKLKNITDSFIPDDAGELKKIHPHCVEIGIDAIKEMNEMQGHYAPAKQEIKQEITGEEKHVIGLTNELYRKMQAAFKQEI